MQGSHAICALQYSYAIHFCAATFTDWTHCRALICGARFACSWGRARLIGRPFWSARRRCGHPVDKPASRFSGVLRGFWLQTRADCAVFGLFSFDRRFSGDIEARFRTVVLASRAGVAELVDALDLGSSAARRGGSSPLTRTRCRAAAATDASAGRFASVTSFFRDRMRDGCFANRYLGKPSNCGGLSGADEKLIEGKTCRSLKRSTKG